ncbi:ALD2 (YMR170C) [Zygosaccharomyces parabailii]|nr:ALD2 (YMR170C) [Zygosaccharomyces parabailii]
MSLFQEIALASGDKYSQPLGLFIDNEFVASSNGSVLVTTNPATGKQITQVHAADPGKDVDEAVKAARKAFKPWKSVPITEKRDLFLKLAQLVKENTQLLAQVESLDSGKPLHTNAYDDIDGVVQTLTYLAGWIDKTSGEAFSPSPGKLCYTLHQPLGVVGCIIPFNYPLSMMSWKWTAIATGNTAVFKSAHQTPLSILVFAQLVVEAGFPPGVFNVISGEGGTVGDALVRHLGVDKIAFTGSTKVGQLVQSHAAVNLKPVTLECGGKSPLMVFEDADLEEAVKWAAFGIFHNMGQICSGTSRCFVQESKYEEFLTKLAAHVTANFPVGSPLGEDIVVGPQITKAQQERVMSFIDSGIKEGCRVVLGGTGLPEVIANDAVLANGYYVRPTILADVKPHYKIAQEEVFGPVLAVGTFCDYDDALRIANDSQYGLGAGIFSQDIKKCHEFADEVESGMVWINSSNDLDFHMPFGGVKMSGHGRELGKYGLLNFTNVKAVYVNMCKL